MTDPEITYKRVHFAPGETVRPGDLFLNSDRGLTTSHRAGELPNSDKKYYRQFPETTTGGVRIKDEINPVEQEILDAFTPVEQEILDAFTHCAMVLIPLSHEARQRIRNTLDSMFGED